MNCDILSKDFVGDEFKLSVSAPGVGLAWYY